jgi:hypothetical protein
MIEIPLMLRVDIDVDTVNATSYESTIGLQKRLKEDSD